MTLEKFRFISKLTLLSLYLVVFAGGFVRMTGSGMGCPDWPKCFGKIVPPTSDSDLPENYQELYTEKRVKKTQRFADFLQKIGFAEQADFLHNHPMIGESEKFSAIKAWTEYVNRICGVLCGFLIILNLICAFVLKPRKFSIIALCFLQLIVVLIQGWFGSIVVATNITPWVLTLHMLLALLLISIQLLILFYSRFESSETQMVFFQGARWFLLTGTIILLVQICFGTQVRQQVDAYIAQMSIFSRYEMMHNLTEQGGWILIHRSFSWVAFLIYAYLFFINLHLRPGFEKITYLFVAMVVQIVVGVLLMYAGLPRLAQLAHILLSALLYGFAFYAWLEVNSTRMYIKREVK